jgi:sialic acid synthase SpsE
MPEDGISPNEIENVVGKIANLDIKKDSVIYYDMLL